MRGMGTTACGLVLALLLGGCDTLDGRYTREGLGTDLYTADVAEGARLQELYVGYICQQAGLEFVQSGDVLSCREPAVSPNWEIFVQAGLNDIDRRCDNYLTWLDNKRRSVGPIHQQILDSEATTLAILAATAADPTRSIAIVGAAFGLAAHSFTNFNSRFLFEVEKSTVQSVVLTRQQKYRKALPRVIDNRPAAIYALRQYLRLCMPMTIETQINTTVKLFERGGTASLTRAAENPMIDARTVSTATTQSTGRTRGPADGGTANAIVSGPDENTRILREWLAKDPNNRNELQKFIDTHARSAGQRSVFLNGRDFKGARAKLVEQLRAAGEI